MRAWGQTGLMILKDKMVMVGMGISLLISGGMTWLVLVKISSLPDEIPLWYTAPPIEQLAPVAYLWLLPGIAVGSWVINALLIGWMYRRYVAVSRSLVMVTLAVVALAVIATIKTILIFSDLL